MGEPSITPRSRRPVLAGLVAVALAGLAGGCASTAPTATPTGRAAGQPSDPPVFGRDWGRSTTLVERPADPGGYIRMNDVAVVDGTFIAVGDYSGLQYATMVAWSSQDGVDWTRAYEVPAFGQCEPYGVVAGPVPVGGAGTVSGVVAVGSFGNPDDYVPTAWLSPAH